MMEENKLVGSETENGSNEFLIDLNDERVNLISTQFQPSSISNLDSLSDDHSHDVINTCELMMHLSIPVLIDQEECELKNVMLYSCPKWIEY
jgi:hypothetical protein